MLAYDAAFLSQLDSDQSTDAMPAVEHTLAGHADDVKALRADSNVETPVDDLYGNIGQDFAAVDKALTPTRTSKTTGIEVNTFGKATLNAWQAGVDGGSDDILDKDGNKIEDKTVGKDGQSQSTARPGEMG